MRKPKIGLLLICSNRFRHMGTDTAASYPERQQRVVEGLTRSIGGFGQVVETGQIYEREDVTAAMDTFYRERVDCVFASYLSWSDDFHWIRFLRDMYPIPILFGSIEPDIDYENTWNEGDFVQFLCNGGMVGALEGSGSAARFRRPMLQYAVGSQEEVLARLRVFAQAAALRSEMRCANFGLLEFYNEVMWSTYIDPYLFFQVTGAELRFISVATLEDYCKKVSPERVEDCVRELSRTYEVLDDVDPGHFRASVRASLAVEDIAVDCRLSAVALNDVDKTLYEHIGLRPGFLPTPGGPGITVTPEGDLGACLAVHLLRRLSGQHTLMLEMDYIDRRDNTMVLVHGGPNDYTDPKGKTKIARDVRFAKTSYKHAGAPFAWHCLYPGEKTIVHISQSRDTLKMVVLLAEAVPEDLNLCSYTQGRVRFSSGTPAQVAQRLMEIGVTQHFAVAAGNHRQVLRDYAGMMGYEYYEL